MTTEEQDSVLGSTMLEHRKLKRKVACFQKKASDTMFLLSRIGGELESGKPLTDEDLEGYPSAEQLQTFSAEFSEAKEKLDELAERLREMDLYD